jgi:arginase family enzyme
MRRLIESGAVLGRNFVQVGLRGYWPPVPVLEWMREQGLRWHLMTEIEERGAEAVVDDAIAEALDGPDAIYLSVDIDVVDPGSAPGTGTPEPGGMLPRELLRAVRRIVGQVDLAGMDIVEVSPPYDWAESTAMIANRVALEAISALAVKRRAGADIRFDRAAAGATGPAKAAARPAPRTAAPRA